MLADGFTISHGCHMEICSHTVHTFPPGENIGRCRLPCRPLPGLYITFAPIYHTGLYVMLTPVSLSHGALVHAGLARISLWRYYTYHVSL